MRKVIYLIAVFLLTISMANADLALPGEFEPVLAKAVFRHRGVRLSIEKVYDKEARTVTLRASNFSGENVWTSESLGEEEKLVTVMNRPTSLMVRDIDGDGINEIIAAAKTGLDSSALYVFKYDAEKQTFVPMDFTYEKEKFSRHFLVSDILQENNKDIIITQKGNIRATGKIYTEDQGPIPGFYYFEANQGEYVCKLVETQEEFVKKQRRR
jgi:hypothetical protein